MEATHNRSRAWLRRHTAELRLALRMTASGLLAYALAELLGLAQGYWAVFTAVIVVQASVGGSLKAGIDRLLGTLGGAFYGALVGLIIPHAEPFSRGATLAVAVAPLALLAAMRASFRIAPVTAIIVLLSTSGGEAGPFAAAVARVSEIGLGCIVGLGVSLLVLPARAHGLVAKTASRNLALIAEVLSASSARLAGAADRRRLAALNDRLRGALRQLEAIGREAQRERRSRLSGAPDPEPLVRGLRRLRADLVVIALASEPLTQASLAALGAPLAAAIAGVAEALRRIGASLAAASELPSIDATLVTLAAYAAAMDQFRASPLALDLPAAETERIFALSFALAQLRGDLSDIALRAAAFAGRTPTAA
ncbi:MAG TPA: FUSC family protein [Stellaceae bacterium]|nr:FUSC family protein [Stellaceae bacterium]